MRRNVLCLLALTSCLDEAPPELGEVDQSSLAVDGKLNRWYADDNQVTYFAYQLDPADWQKTYQAIKEYNRVSPLKFVSGCPEIEVSESVQPDCNPLTHQTGKAHLIYTTQDLPDGAGGGRTYSWSSMMDPTYPGSIVIQLTIGLRARPAASGRHEDYVVAYDVATTMPTLNIPLHETGHVLGLTHEQKRDDAYLFQNIYTCCSNLDPQAFAPEPTNTKLAPYDYQSIMQYKTGFANGCYSLLAPIPLLFDLQPPVSATATCTPQDANGLSFPGLNITQAGFKIPEPTALSAEDINTLWQMYPRNLGDSEALDHYGQRMVAGDFDGDGYQDLAVAAPNEVVGSNPFETGAVFVYKGTFTGLMPWRTIAPSTNQALLYANSHFGGGLGATDLDNDGADELVVGLPDAIPMGAVLVYHGTDAGPRDPIELRPGAIGGKYGKASAGFTTQRLKSVGAESIVVLDHRLAVGSPGGAFVETWTFTTGASWTASSLVRGSRLTGQPGSEFGAAIIAGRLDPDGFDDLVIGAPGNRVVNVAIGTPFDGFGGWIYLHDPWGTGSRFGEAVAITRGPIGGVVVGAPGANGGNGRAYVMNLNDTVKRTMQPSNFNWGSAGNGSNFGAAVAAGETDGTGTDHIFVGAPFAGIGGRVGIYAVKSDLTIDVGVWFGEVVANARHGTSIAIGNFNDRFNDDRLADIAIGAPAYNNGAGTVWVLKGAYNAPPEIAHQTETTGFLEQHTQAELRR